MKSLIDVWLPFATILILTRIIASESIPCAIDTTLLGDKEPLFLTKERGRHYFKIPVNGIIHLNHNDYVVLGCTVETYDLGTLTDVQCQNGRLYNLTTRANINENDMQCPEKNRIWVKSEKIIVPGNLIPAELYEVGYWLKDNDFVGLYEVCYRESDQTAVYTKHTLHGATLARHHKKGNRRPSYFNSQSVASSVRNSYLIEHQEENLPTALMTTGGARRVDEYFARGHLSRWADGIFLSHKLATNYFINVNPQWQRINNGNFGVVEDKAAALATRLGRDLKVITGGHGTLKVNGFEIKLGLTKVPEYIFKIIVDMHQKAGIALVVSNNPKSNSAPTLCEDQCTGQDNNGWNFPNKNDPVKGYTICCKLSDFMANVSYIGAGLVGLNDNELGKYLSFD